MSASNPTSHVTFLDGRGELPMLEITTPWSTAEIYLHGAHVTHFKKNGEPPLLFLSQCSRFEKTHRFAAASRSSFLGSANRRTSPASMVLSAIVSGP